MSNLKTVNSKIEKLLLIGAEQSKVHHGQSNAPMVTMYALLNLEKKIETQAGVEYGLINKAFVDAEFSEAGFETMEDWLDSFGWVISSNGRRSQIYRIATTFTAWCVEQGISVNNNVVNSDWFKDFIIRKCRVSRTRLVLRVATNVIESDMELDRKRDEIILLLSLVDDPNLTNEDIVKEIKEASEVIKINASVQRIGDMYTVTYGLLTPEHMSYLVKKASSFTEFEGDING